MLYVIIFIRIFLLWMDFMEEHIKIISERFAKDSLMALATVTNEDDPNTIILKIKLTGGTLFSNGKRFDF